MRGVPPALGSRGEQPRYPTPRFGPPPATLSRRRTRRPAWRRHQPLHARGWRPRAGGGAPREPPAPPPRPASPRPPPAAAIAGGGRLPAAAATHCAPAAAPPPLQRGGRGCRPRYGGLALPASSTFLLPLLTYTPALRSPWAQFTSRSPPVTALTTASGCAAAAALRSGLAAAGAASLREGERQGSSNRACVRGAGSAAGRETPP